MTDFDTTNEGAPTAPLPIADDGTQTVPLPPVNPAQPPQVPMPPAHVAWRPSTGGIVAIALAGAMAVSALSFGAGWGAHGLTDRFAERRGLMMSAQNGPGSFGQGNSNGYGRGGAREQESNGYDERGWREDSSGGYGGRGMGLRGQDAPGGAPGQSQQGYQQDGSGSGVCPGQTW